MYDFLKEIHPKIHPYICCLFDFLTPQKNGYTPGKLAIWNGNSIDFPTIFPGKFWTLSCIFFLNYPLKHGGVL